MTADKGKWRRAHAFAGGRLNFRRAPRTPVSLAQSFHSIIASILRSGVHWARLSWGMCWVPN